MQGSSDNGFPLKQLINGEWQDAIGGGTWDLIDPGSEDLVTQVPYGDGADATAAIDAAGCERRAVPHAGDAIVLT